MWTLFDVRLDKPGVSIALKSGPRDIGQACIA